MASAEEAVQVALVTAPDEACARRLARTLVDERLAACVNLVPGLRSVYRYEGTVHEDAEVLLIVKTRADRARELEDRVIELHPYDLPEVIRLDVAGGSPAYLRWLCEEASP